MNMLKRYRFVLGSLVLMIGLYLINRELGAKAVGVTVYSLKEMLLIIPPVFILLGLLDVWVSKETMARYMGPGSGIKGIVLSFVVGSVAAGPLYGAFPVAAVFMKKGVKFSNVLIFVGAWSTTKIPLLLFEMSALGLKFALVRLLVDIPGIVAIAFTLTRFIPDSEIERLYEKTQSL
ncbi:MAG: permease [Erysipelotrichaceae bacterium]|nr:permease [Erysipelotrichaceae bacterium]MDD3810451.1 permease [Erysipelotrichaceae bacterium]